MLAVLSVSRQFRPHERSAFPDLLNFVCEDWILHFPFEGLFIFVRY